MRAKVSICTVAHKYKVCRGNILVLRGVMFAPRENNISAGLRFGVSREHIGFAGTILPPREFHIGFAGGHWFRGRTLVSW